jgi:hypothetical protein
MKAPDADEWIKAMEFEVNMLDRMCVWETAELPVNTNIIGSKWVYCYKYNPSDQVIKRRAHLVTQGFTQKLGMDYGETFC